jgi:hypothetical protein
MKFLRDVWADLLEKRLWPVAAALVLALVAIPVLLLHPAAAPKAQPPTVAQAGPAPLVTDPTQVTAALPSGPVAGTAHNPFNQQHVPKATASASSPTAAPGGGPGTTPSTGGTGGTGSTGSTPSIGGSGPSPASPRHSSPASDSGPRLKVRFGPTDGKRPVRLLSAGTALPSRTNPTLVFVDVHRASKVEFIVSSDAVPQGDGSCQPTKAICAQLFMHPGDTEFFDVTKSSGKVVQYQLDVLDVIG